MYTRNVINTFVLTQLTRDKTDSFEMTLRTGTDETYVRASELYKRFRTWVEMYYNNTPTTHSDISDVKLAEHFGEYFKSKRMAFGKVWLGCQIAYDLDWDGPTVVGNREIIMHNSCNITMSDLRSGAIRNAKFIGAQNVKLKCGECTYDLIHEGDSYITPKNLWITQPTWTEITFIIKTVQPVNITFEYGNTTPGSIYNYSNSVDEYSFSVIAGVGKYQSPPQVPCEYTPGSRPQDTCEYTLLDQVCEFRGARTKNANDGLLALVLANTDYSIVHDTTQILPYIEKIDGLYYQCFQFNLIQSSDWIIIHLSNLQLPIDMCTITICGEPIIDGTVVNMGSTKFKYCRALVDIRTKFGLPTPPDRNLFQDYTMKLDNIFLNSTIRCVQHNMLDYFDNLHTAFTAFAKIKHSNVESIVIN